MSYVSTVAGLLALIVGAELLVRGAVALALRTGLSTLVIGLTIVSLGTGTPELAVAARSGATGEAELALGNVIGSNIANVLLVLGLAAMMAGAGLAVTEKVVRVDVPVMVGVSIGVLLLALDGTVSRFEGAVLLAGLLAYVTWTVWEARRVGPDEDADVVAEFDEAVADRAGRHPAAAVGLLAAGLLALSVGATWLVGGATDIARQWGVSELVIGLTVVAIGTTAPEIATSVVAAIRGEQDLAVANVVGSNLFNLLGVLGLTAVVSGDGVAVGSQALRLDLPVMVAAAVACLPVFLRGFRVTRAEGALFLGAYATYLLVLFVLS
jgi:cation:H+ antiporter